MREIRMSHLELALIAVTRNMLGIGIGLLISGRFGRKRRVAVGATLAAVGALSTIPLALKVLGTPRRAKPDRRDGLPAERDREARGDRPPAVEPRH